MALEARRSTTETTSIEDRAFKGVGDLIRVLPSGTVFLFQFLSPLLTNAGHCTAVNKWLSGALLLASGFSCAFSSFTDSFVDPAGGKVYYGVVTKNGMWAFSDPNAGARDLSEYRLRLGDFVHASLALLVFAALALLDNNTVSCFYPTLLAQEKTCSWSPFRTSSIRDGVVAQAERHLRVGVAALDGGDGRLGEVLIVPEDVELVVGGGGGGGVVGSKGEDEVEVNAGANGDVGEAGRGLRKMATR